VVDPVRRWGQPSRGAESLDAIAVLRDRLIGGCAVIRAVRGHLNNRIVNLIEQRADLGRIVDVLIR
jgi:hypothetical protein